MTSRHIPFALFSTIAFVLFRAPLRTLLDLSVHDWRYSHIAVIPLVWTCVVYCRREQIFRDPRPSLSSGVPVLIAGLIVYCIAAPRFGAREDGLWARVLAGSIVWTAGFIICYGLPAFRAGMFAFSLLLFMVPIPAQVLSGMNSVLQKGSAEVSYALLRAAGVPVFRDGVRFSIPGFEIEVAEECSGLRSATALLITGLLAGRTLLRTAGGRILLALLTIPIAIFKNAVRIAMLCWLSSYVDESFMFGKLHRQGGLPFSVLALVFLLFAILVLRRAEAQRTKVTEVSLT